MAEQRNAGRRVISQATVQAIAAKAGVQRPVTAAVKRDSIARNSRRVAIAMAGSAALLAVGGLVFLTAPDPSADPLLGPLLKFAARENRDTGERTYPVAGGFAYPRIKTGTFGGKFILDQKADQFKADDPPLLVPDGKFYVAKIPPDSDVKPAPNEDGAVNADNIMAIYQVCPHLGCLVPYISTEKRFICPCYGSTYERNSKYVRGPAPRSLDQFRVTVVNGTITVNTGQRVLGQPHP